jgi:hypothetical protein
MVLAASAFIGWAASSATAPGIGIGSLAALAIVSGSEARADTAIQPGWIHSCGRNPRCFERGEWRRRQLGEQRRM